MVEPDTIIDGRYRVLSRVGSGGMADVYLAEDQLLGRHVAVKLLHHHFAEDQEFVERFRREASSAAALSHPNIVAIFDRGEWQGTYYIAMEYVAGRSLKTIVREQGALNPATAIDIVVQILRATRFAHKRGVIHRDLKPHNVILDEEGRARVTDFGIARAGASDMTLTGSIMGTAQYLSPEQAQGLAVSTASDLYSVGVIMYELLTGVVPFEGESAVAIAFKQVAAEPRRPSAVLDSVPVALDEVVLRALAKDPSRRYADADEFIAALERDREALPASAGAAVLAAGAFGAEAWAVAGGREPPAGQFGPGGADPGTGALMLPPAPGPDEDTGISHGDGPRPKTVLLWSLAAALVAGAIALALLAGGGGGRVAVPYVVGQTELAAAAKLRGVGLLAVASREQSASVTSGLVIRQSPPLGARVSKGTRVSIVVSSGPGSAALPAVEGLTTAEALHNLRAAGFKPTTRSQSSATIARGRVIGTDPPTGTETQLGSAVVVLVSSGPAQLRVPEVVGESQKGAEGSLANAGLVVGPITTVSSTSQPPGSVLSQSPSAGASVPAGSPVSLTVAQAPTEIPVPNVVGNNETQAAATLGGAGFVPKTATATTTDPTKVGVVLKQSPGAGQSARKGATVTLTIGTLGPTTTTTTPTNTTTTPAPATTPTATTPATPPPAPSG